MNHRCAICQEYMLGTSWVCAKCRLEFKLTQSQKQWPLWAKAAVAEENRQRRKAKIDRQFLSDYELDENILISD